MKSLNLNCRVVLLFFVMLVPMKSFCQNGPSVSEIRNNTKKLMTTFLIDEDLDQLAEMLDESLKFYWPNTKIDTKEGVLKACQSITSTKDNNAELIDLIVEDNRAFILFIWSGKVTKDENELQVGKEFAIHDAWKVTWENGKVVEWYTIWGSMDYMTQLGYKLTPPSE